MKFDIYGFTNQGGREYNQDAIAYKTNEERALVVVADGLGGHSFGELASECVCNTMVKYWDGSFGGSPKNYLEESIKKSNRAILGIQEEKSTVLKSTVVALAIEVDKAVWANVGDSRLYYLQGGETKAVTNDHSVAFKKYKAGEITREAIATDPDQSALLRTVGSEDRCKPEVYEEVTIGPGDAFMLCSDGVWEYIKEAEIAVDYAKAVSAKQWAELLLMRLMHRVQKENDNLSIVTVMVQ